jgi:hypothetical protein
MRRLLSCFVVSVYACVFANACASGGSVGSSVAGRSTSNQPATAVIRPDTGLGLSSSAEWTTSTYDAPPDVVWAAAKKFYATFEIPLTFEDRAAHELGNQNFYKSRAMGGHPMTAWANCGSTLTGESAATDRVYMTSVTEILPAGRSGSQVRTTFAATSQDIGQATSRRKPCVSTGRFEQAILDDIKKTVAK